MLISEQEILELRNFVFQLNESEESIVIVEGKRDAMAIKKNRISGKILEFIIGG